MASNKNSTNQPRFSVQFDEGQLVIFDSVSWRTVTAFPAGTTRTHAAKECAALNAAGITARAPRDARSPIEPFQKPGTLVTFEEIDRRVKAASRHDGGYVDKLDPDIYGKLRLRRLLAEEQQKQIVTAAIEKWLPNALREWGAAVAEHYGYGEQKRNKWAPWRIVEAWKAAGYYRASAMWVYERTPIDPKRNLWREVFQPISKEQRFIEALLAKLKPDLRILHEEVWLDGGIESEADTREVLVVHFVSSAPAREKAILFGVEKRAYLSQVNAACQQLVRWLVSEYCDREGGEWLIAQEEDEWYENRHSHSSPRRPRPKPPRQEGKPAPELSDAEAKIKENMERLRAVFGHQSHAQTIPARESLIENKRSLSEAGINGSAKSWAPSAGKVAQYVRLPSEARKRPLHSTVWDPAKCEPYPAWASEHPPAHLKPRK
jgi:hypothetical protein